MAFANSSITDIIATTLLGRSGTIADNVTANNALLARLKARGKIKTASGGQYIVQELSFAENPNVGWYSGYDPLPINAADVISGAQFNWKQAAVPVVISGIEMLKNSGKERVLDLLESRVEVAESTMANLLSAGIYSDGTGTGSKQMDGLLAMAPVDPTATPYAGIDGNVYAFWRNQVKNVSGYTTVQADMLELWSSCNRGGDRPDIMPCSAAVFNAYVASLQALHQFTHSNTVDGGFQAIKYMDMDVILDGGIYAPATVTGATGATANRGYMLNTKYCFLRPHANRNMVPLSPNKRYAVNQDAEVQILAWAGNFTCSGRMFQGVYDGA